MPPELFRRLTQRVSPLFRTRFVAEIQEVSPNLFNLSHPYFIGNNLPCSVLEG